MKSRNVLQKEIPHITASGTVKWTAEAPSIRLPSINETILFQRNDVFLELVPSLKRAEAYSLMADPPRFWQYGPNPTCRYR